MCDGDGDWGEMVMKIHHQGYILELSHIEAIGVQLSLEGLKQRQQEIDFCWGDNPDLNELLSLLSGPGGV